MVIELAGDDFVGTSRSIASFLSKKLQLAFAMLPLF